MATEHRIRQPARGNTDPSAYLAYLPHWSVAAVTLLVLDPGLTWLALSSGLGFEANPVLAPILAWGGILALVLVKIAVLVAVFVAWVGFPKGSFHGWLPRFAAGAGLAIVVWNVANIVLSVLFRTGFVAEVLA